VHPLFANWIPPLVSFSPGCDHNLRKLKKKTFKNGSLLLSDAFRRGLLTGIGFSWCQEYSTIELRLFNYNLVKGECKMLSPALNKTISENWSPSKEELEILLCTPIAWELYVIQGIATVGVFLPAIFINLITIVVLSRPSMKSTFNFLLSILITMDTIYLIEPVFMRGLRHIFEHHCIAYNYLLFFVPLANPYLFGMANTGKIQQRS